MPSGYASTVDMLKASSTPVSTGLGNALGIIAYPSTVDMLNASSMPVSTGLFGYLGESPGTDEEAMVQPQESPRGTDWLTLLQKGLEIVPTAVVKGVTAYQAYETAGGGGAGAQQALLTAFGPQGPTPAQQAQIAAAQAQAAAAVAAAAKPWYQNPVYVIGGIAIVGLAAWALSRK